MKAPAVAALAIALAIGLAVIPARATPVAEAPVYTIETYPYQRAPALKQWRSVLTRNAELEARWSGEECTDGAPDFDCAAKEAHLLEEKLHDLEPSEQVAAVYAYFNAFKYKAHERDCGDECWASRIEFIAKREGDCGDHALAEYFTLRRLGFEERNLQLIIAQLPGYEDSFKGGHVVLRVFADGKYFILDNRRTKLIGLRGLRKYKVLAGLNADSVQVYNLASGIAPPGYVTDEGQLALLLASPAAGEQPTLVAESQPPKATPRPVLKPIILAAVETDAPAKQAESSADQDEAPEECIQGARLADWNPNLPCMPNRKPKALEEETPAKVTATTSEPPKKAVEIATDQATAKPTVVASAEVTPKQEASAEEEEDSGACMQGAKLADWNPNLPCTPVKNTYRIKVKVKIKSDTALNLE